MLFAFAMPAAAQQDFMSAPLIKPGEEALVVNLGGILNQFDSRVQINGQRLNGSDIDLEGNGLPHDDWSFQAAASWRFLPRHRIDVQYFSTKRSGTATYERSVTIGENEYPLGATVSIEAKDQFLLADYRYSFVKNDAIEFAGIIGVYGGRFEFDVNATGIAGTVSASANTTASTTVPLPLIGVAMDWYVNPRWKIAGSVEGIKAHIGSVDGRAVVAALSTDYMFVRNVGVGIRYMYSDLSVEVSKSRFNGTADWRMNSVSAYLRLAF